MSHMVPKTHNFRDIQLFFLNHHQKAQKLVAIVECKIKCRLDKVMDETVLGDTPGIYTIHWRVAFITNHPVTNGLPDCPISFLFFPAMKYEEKRVFEGPALIPFISFFHKLTVFKNEAATSVDEVKEKIIY